ncbi:mitogen-activated protein kinase kinase kinase 7 [Drosophila ficusphila]|uniref:mitogen-activated protein kinase kinase kinase 7 n=1 Tax=Drosophila ficusphila TaxID=30025 RepID=UPI0007E7E575|nr:mitogen-activated protein kinase kinase kinase 7 [Drosophila ficusphila]
MTAAVEYIPYEEFTLGELIGSGTFGSVSKASWRDREIAVKKIRPGCEDQQIEREINQLSRVDHKNIIKLYGISKHDRCFHLLMEYVKGGSLDSFLHAESKPTYSLAHALNWALQIAQGVAYLHAMKPKPVIHRDIKPLNCLLDQSGLSLKICDFGTVVDVTLSMTTGQGTCIYTAPEVFLSGHYNEKCDVYSWAITFWETLSRKAPFKDLSFYDLSMAIPGGDRPKPEDIIPGCPDDIVSVMTTCWDKEPKRRLSMELVAYIVQKFLREAGPLQHLDYNFGN